MKQLPVPGAQKVTLAAAHVAARGVVAFTADGAGRVATIPPPGADFPGVGGTFGGTANMTGAWVAASD